MIFDIETNGLLEPRDGSPPMDTIHCIVTRSASTVRVYHDHPTITPRHGSIAEGVAAVEQADLLVGHNIADFDLRAIKKLHPKFAPRGKVRDTLVKARLLFPDTKEGDIVRVRRGGTFPMRLAGRHSLEAWGHRLGVYKGDFGKTSDWTVFTQEMLDYCIQDTLVNAYLLEYLDAQPCSEMALELEHEFAEIIGVQERHGFLFDVPAAQALTSKLQQRIVEVDALLTSTIEPFVNEYETAVKKIKKTKVVPFNPASRDHIARHLMERRGWVPKAFTDGGGKPQIDESILAGMAWPEAKLLDERFMVAKRLAQVADGKQAWLKLVGKDGRIHGRMNTNGAVTGRCTHSSPNMAQVPGNRSPYGHECRSLFKVPKGRRLVGADASGLELRCLANYMALYDGGAYVKVLLEGDVHTTNQEAAGLPDRDRAKTFIYAFLYGAGDEKIGSIVGKGAAVGKKLKTQFLAKTPALARLRQDVTKAAASGYLIAPDGRRLAVRHKHAALNTLLQGAGAIVVKLATVLLRKQLAALGIILGVHYCNVAHVHDEIQLEVDEAHAEVVGQQAVLAIRRAGEVLKFRCPLDGEFKVGNTWAETH